MRTIRFLVVLVVLAVLGGAAFVWSGIYPVGALVRLRSGRAARVIGENPEDPTHPPLVSVPDAEHPETERLDPAVEEIVGMESAEALSLESWESKRTQLIKRFRS